MLVPLEVLNELQAGGLDCAEVRAVNASKVCVVTEHPVDLPLLLSSQLDRGEASVIQNAVLREIPCLKTCFERMHAQGIWISRDLQEQAVNMVNQ